MFVDTTAAGPDAGGVVRAIEQLKPPGTFHPSGVRVGVREILQTFNHSVVATHASSVRAVVSTSYVRHMSAVVAHGMSASSVQAPRTLQKMASCAP